MTDHFPLMVPGSKATSPPREVSAPYDGTLLATVDTADSRQYFRLPLRYTLVIKLLRMDVK
jgi:hypothetical protein